MGRGESLFLVGAGRAILNGVVLTAILASVCQAGTIYVDDDAPLGGDGTTWTTAYKYFQDALANADTNGTEIRVAQGTYKPDQDKGGTVTPGDRTAAFELLNNVAIYGGYAGIGAPDPDLRNVDDFVSIFSGDLANDDAPDFVNYDENSHHVITVGAEITDSAVLDGVTVEHGNANGSSEEKTDRGAGMLIFGSPAILNCTLHKNTALYGSAVCNWDGPNPTFTGCTFSENVAVNSGGAIYCYSDLTLLNCLIEGNQAKWGGGFYADGEGTDVTLQNVTIRSNEAIRDTVEYLGSSGGGVYLGNSVNATFENCTIEANSAMWGGGIAGFGNSVNASLQECTIRSNEALYSAVEDIGGSGGGVFLEDGACAMIDNCVIEGNNGTRGGGVYLFNGGLLTMSNCQVRENWVATGDSGSGWGGGIGLWESEIYLASSRIYGNAAPSGGGGLSIYGAASSRVTLGSKGVSEQLAPPDARGGMGQSVPCATRKASEDSSKCRGLGLTVADSAFFNNTAGWGGGLAISAKDPTVINCTFGENDADNQGGGVFCMFSGSVILGNCVLWGNVAMGGWQLALYIDCVGTVSYSNVENGEGNVYVDQSTLNWGEGNMDVDPLFVDPDGSDGVPGTEDDDFRLSPGSLCITAGSNGLLPPDTADLDGDNNQSEPIPIDLDGHARILCDPIDMGAYEFGIGDYNCDQTIDLTDFALWDSCMTGPDNGPYDSGCEAFDFEFDGDVDMQDFARFQVAFGGP